jgi:hypothetical protein
MHRRSPAISPPLTDLSILVDSLGWLRSVARRQASQSWQPIKCGPFREAVSVHIARFRREWTAALHAIAEACPAAREQCAILGKLDLPPARVGRRDHRCAVIPTGADRPAHRSHRGTAAGT